MTRLWRTIRPLSPAQVVHRLRLRALARARRALPGTAARWAALRAGAVPPLRGVTCIPASVARPAPFPAPTDVPLLWSYHLEYMEYLLDLALAGTPAALAAIGPLVDARLTGERGPAATHPYTDSRRVVSWCRVMGHHPSIARGAWTWANRVAKNLEWDVGGNHLLENGLALVLAGAHFEGRRARVL
ncbi:MAG: hypothetical protein ACYS99_19690, partial [Planctomycetota bacterium]